jgi:hypothetical protein
MASSGMLRRVALVKADVSEELSAFFIRVTRISELETTPAVTSNRLFLRSVLRLLVTASDRAIVKIIVVLQLLPYEGASPAFTLGGLSPAFTLRGLSPAFTLRGSVKLAGEQGPLRSHCPRVAGGSPTGFLGGVGGEDTILSSQ